MKRLALAALLALSLAGCREETVATAPPVTLTPEAVGRYCGMNLIEHEGPKGQVVLAEGHDPFWFSSARDTLAFTMMPDEPKDYAAVYVSDMGRAASWADPGADNWVEASDHAAFHRAGLPFLYFGVNYHTDYHRPSDDFEKVNPAVFQDATELAISGFRALDQWLDQ